MDLLGLLAPVVIIGVLMWLGTLVWPYPRNAELRREIEAQVCFATSLRRASFFGTRGSGFAGTRGGWIPLQGPKRLTIGTGAFMITARQALKQFAFRGSDCSIAFSQQPSRFTSRDWIVITGQSGDREVQVAITNHNLQEIWQALAATGASAAGQEVPIGHLPSPPRRPVRSEPYPLRTLAMALVIVLLADSAVWLGAIGLPSLGVPGSFGLFVALVMFGVWFYRARINADRSGWPQRRPPGSAIWAWFVPVINLFYPFQIMADIWRAGLPAQMRAKPAILPAIWWTCWLAFFLLSAVTTNSAHQVRYVGIAIKVTGVLAAIMTSLLVQKISSGPPGGTAEPQTTIQMQESP